MFNFTSEEKKVALFILGLAFCGLILSSLAKVNAHVEKIINPPVQLARIDLNRVKPDELIKLRCLPKKLAQRILEYRALHQGFADLEELKEVKGIGQKRYEKLKGIFFVE